MVLGEVLNKYINTDVFGCTYYKLSKEKRFLKFNLASCQRIAYIPPFCSEKGRFAAQKGPNAAECANTKFSPCPQIQPS